MNDRFKDSETDDMVQILIKPDKLKVFHLIPRYAIMRRIINYRKGEITWKVDETTQQILYKDGGKIIAEDCSLLTENQIFSFLNYDEIKVNARIHAFLRKALNQCNDTIGMGRWFVGDLLEAIRNPLREDMDQQHNLTIHETELSERLEKYREDGAFVRNEEEREEYGYDFREIIRKYPIINISFLGFKRNEIHGQNLVKGHTDIFLDVMRQISNEYYSGVRRIEQGLPLSDWEKFLQKHWKVTLVFEESEIYVSPVDRDLIKSKPCLRTIEDIMSIGRKLGFKNLLFVTQRVPKVNKLLWEETSVMFLGPVHGEQRDTILKSYGVDKIEFKSVDDYGNQQKKRIKDVVTTLSKESHQWVLIRKEDKKISAIETFDAPVG